MFFQIMLRVIFPIFIVVLAGYLFGRWRRLDTLPLTDLIIYITSPCLVLSALLKAHLQLGQFLLLAGAAFWVIIGLGFGMFLVYRWLPGESRRGYFLPVMFMNTGNVGLPVALLSFGPLGLSLALVYHTANAVLAYTLGVALVAGQKPWLSFWRIPYLYTALLAVYLNQQNISLPGPLLEGIKILGDLTIPLMLVMLGYQLSRTVVRHLGLSLLLSCLRLGGGLLLALLFVKIFSLQGLPAQVIILMSVLPSAVASHLLAQKYRAAEEVVASVVAVSTLLTLIVIPLVLVFLV